MKKQPDSFAELRAINADSLKRQPDIDAIENKRLEGLNAHRALREKDAKERKDKQDARVKNRKQAETERLKRAKEEITNPSGDKA